MEPQPIGVLVVDDHDMFAESLARVLRDEPGIEVVGCAATSAAAVERAELLRPDVAIVDYLLPDADGIATATRVRAVSPDTRVLILTAVGDIDMVLAAVRAGCSGFLTKDKAVAELVIAVRMAHAGEAYLPPGVLAGLLPRLSRGHRGVGADLSQREREILQLVASGLGNKAIAVRLSLSVHTVRNHVRNVLAKLHAHSKLEAVAIAGGAGLIDRTG